MVNFQFSIPTRVYFVREEQKRVGELLKAYGATKVLLHYGGASAKKSGLYDQIIASLQAAQIDYIELSGVKANPRLSLVRDGIKMCRQAGVDFLLAVGGGSVIDSAKAIAIGAWSTAFPISWPTSWSASSPRKNMLS